MNENIILALIATVPPTLMALAALVVSLKNSRKSDVIIEKSDVIHELTNSNLTSVKEALITANVKIDKLENILSKK